MVEAVKEYTTFNHQQNFTGFWLCSCSCGNKFSAACWNKANMAGVGKNNWVARCPECGAVSNTLETDGNC